MAKLDAASIDAMMNSASTWKPRTLRKLLARDQFPVELLPSIIRSAVSEATAYIQAPSAMVAGCALSAVSGAVQTRFAVRRDAQLAGPATLFVLTIADSGERKSTVDRLLMKPLRDWEAVQAKAAEALMADHLNELRDWEKQEDRDENERPRPPRVPRMLRSDDTPEALARALAEYPLAIVASAEAGVIFGSHGMSPDSVTRNLAQANAMWDGGPIDQGRISRDRIRIEEMRVSMGLQVQPAVLERFVDKTGGLARGIGYFSRFLLSQPETTQGSRYYRPAPADMPGLNAFHARLSALLELPASFDAFDRLEAHYVPLARAAHDVWVLFHDEVEEQMNPDYEYAEVRDVASKAAENAARLACCFHVFAHDPFTEIGPDIMRKACGVMRWYLAEAVRFGSKHSETEEVRDAEMLEEWLVTYHKKLAREKAAGTLTVNMARQLGPNRLRSRQRLDSALELLQDHGRVRVQRGEGSKSRYIQIAPQVVGEWS